MAPPPPPSAARAPTGLAVVGSANLDLMMRVAQLPRTGQTVLGDDHRQFPGGKGANQAVAAARLGAGVEFVGRVGDDPYGQQLRAALDSEDVDLSALSIDEGVPSGLAMITVDPAGDNMIVVSPGANARVAASDVQDAVAGSASAALLVQLEIPMPAVEATAHAKGNRLLVVNPAPAARLSEALLDKVDVLVPNRGELATLVGDAQASGLQQVAGQARTLVDADRGPRSVVVTLGGEGALVVAGAEVTHVPAHPVDVLDTTAAGDAFCAALTVRVMAGDALLDAAHYASVAAALATARAGAQPSLPWANEVAMVRGTRQAP